MGGKSTWSGNPKRTIQKSRTASTGGGDETLAAASVRETTLQATFQARISTSRIRIRLRCKLSIVSNGSSLSDRRGDTAVSMDSSAGAGNAHNGTLKGLPTNLSWGRTMSAVSTVASSSLSNSFEWEFATPDTSSHTYTLCIAGLAAGNNSVYTNGASTDATMEIVEEET